MAKVRVQLNLRGLNALMTSAPVQRVVDAEGERMAAAAGDGFEYVSVGKRPSRRTARGYVQVDSVEGARRQADEAVLERVVSR